MNHKKSQNGRQKPLPESPIALHFRSLILFCVHLSLSDVLSRQRASQIPVPSNTAQKETWRSTMHRAMFPYFILDMLCSAMIPVPFFLPRRFFFHDGMEAWDRFYLSSFAAPCRLFRRNAKFCPRFLILFMPSSSFKTSFVA